MNLSNITTTNFSTEATGNYHCKYYEPDSDLEINVKFGVLMFVGGCGILANIFIIVLALKYTVRKILHHLIINMALSDTIYLFVCMLVFFKYHIPIVFHGVLGVIWCKLIYYIQGVSYTVSLITLLVISIERFRAIRLTLERSRPYTIKQRVALIVVSWLVPMIINAHVLYHIQFYEKYNYCNIQENVWKLVFFIVLVETLMRITVVITISTFSILTIKRLSRPQAIQAHLNEEQQSMRSRRTRAAVAMVLVSLLLYVCCWFPYLVNEIVLRLYIIFTINSNCYDVFSLVYIIDILLPLVNSCLSPFIYIIFLSDFREAAKRVMCRRTTNQRAPTEEIRLTSIQETLKHEDSTQ